MALTLLIAAGASAYHLAALRPRASVPTMQYDVQAPMVQVFGETQEYQFVSLQPTFTVSDWGRAKAIMEDYLACARAETDTCMYCGWTVSGDQLFARMAHVDGAAVVDHLSNAGPCLDLSLIHI